MPAASDITRISPTNGATGEVKSSRTTSRMKSSTSEATASSPERIQFYVVLRNEGTDVLRPATGVFIAPDVVRIEAPDDYDPADEEWEFPPGSEVRCVAELRSGRQILVARPRSSARLPQS